MKTNKMSYIPIFYLILTLSLTTRGAEVYDDFSSSEINDMLWYIDNADGVLSQSGGLLGAQAPPHLSTGAIWSQIDLYGDFEVILDWRNFSVSHDDPLTTYHQFGLTISDSSDDEKQAHIVRGYGSGPSGWILSWIREGTTFLDSYSGLDITATSGLFKIIRIGSIVSIYYDFGSGYVLCCTAEVTFTGPVYFHIHGQTANTGTFSAFSDWISVDGMVSVPNILGMTETNAEMILNSTLLAKGAVSYDYSDTISAGHVMAQTPNDGVLLTCGSTVDLVISQGPNGGGGGDGCTPPEVESLHPLDVGLRFVYNRLDGDGQTNWTVERQFVEKMTANSQEYYQLRSWNYDNDGQYETGGFIRSTQTELYSYNPSSDKLQFQAAPVGTAWSFYEEHESGLNNKVTEVVAIEEVTVPYGTFCAYKHRKYRHNDSGDSSPYWYEWIVPGVGIVKEVDYWANDGQTAPLMMELMYIDMPPTDPIEEMLDFVDESVYVGTLTGEGSGNSGDNRLNALINMLEEARSLIEAGLYEEACDQLWSAYRKCDGSPIPPDFVTGGAVDDLADMILLLMDELGC